MLIFQFMKNIRHAIYSKIELITMSFENRWFLSICMFLYRVFIKYCVFSLNIFDFSELCQFYCIAGVLPAWWVCTHWHREKDKSPEYSKIFGKDTIFNEQPVRCIPSHNPASFFGISCRWTLRQSCALNNGGGSGLTVNALLTLAVGHWLFYASCNRSNPQQDPPRLRFPQDFIFAAVILQFRARFAWNRHLFIFQHNKWLLVDGGESVTQQDRLLSFFWRTPTCNIGLEPQCFLFYKFKLTMRLEAWSF